MKIKAAAEIGIEANHIKLPRTITQIELLSKLSKLNNDPNVHGIIVQMPLDSENKIDSHLITDAVSPDKDVDGLNTVNEGKVAVGDLSGFLPCTPNGVMELIRRSGVTISGSEAVVLGRSKIVGTPVSELLKWSNATVTVCHSRTKDIHKQTAKADILVVGIGQPEFVKGSWIKPGAVVIDCGINAIPDETKKSGQRLMGDVAFEEAKEVASVITPVPGGVGPMTVAMLMNNTVQSACRAAKKLQQTAWNLANLPPNIKRPVPSILSNPEVLSHLQNLQVQLSQQLLRQQYESEEKMHKLQEMRQQEEEFDKHLAQTVPPTVEEELRFQLSSLKYNELKQLSKGKRLSVKNIKKEDLINALVRYYSEMDMADDKTSAFIFKEPATPLSARQLIDQTLCTTPVPRASSTANHDDKIALTPIQNPVNI